MTDSCQSHVQHDSKCLQEKLNISLQIIRNYDWLIDSYILDFYVDDHWSKLPTAWQNHLEPMDPIDLANILRGNTKCTSVRPLSILCLMSLMNQLCITREVSNDHPNELNQNSAPLFAHPKLKNVFIKCVKPKKRHEVAKMAKVCYSSVLKTSVDFVVDFGAGLGHLARVIGYGYGVKVCCLEMQTALNEQARIIDSQLETTATKYLSAEEKQNFRRPTHITLKLTKFVTPAEFVEKITDSLGIPKDANFSFGIIGLHPCGDLGAIIINMFLSCKEAKFLNFVGCCYMKLSTGQEAHDSGYPLSDFLRKTDVATSCLSYQSREIACHASEVYCDQLMSGKYEDLKIHSFRAATEIILLKYWPDLKHTGLRNVKHATAMQFEDYVERATKGLNINIPKNDLNCQTTHNYLNQWKRIVIFYTLRLLFAPLVESVVLYDRILYLLERGCTVETTAIFDPRLSPRNHITSAAKLD